MRNRFVVNIILGITRIDTKISASCKIFLFNLNKLRDFMYKKTLNLQNMIKNALYNKQSKSSKKQNIIIV